MTTSPSTSPDAPKIGASPTTVSADSYTYWDSPDAARTSEVLSSTECWALATTQAMGRLGVLHNGLLDIFPVNYFVMADHLYFRTSTAGTIATSYLEHAAFQIDHIDKEARSGWTILFNGLLSRVEDPSLLTTLWGKSMDEPWAPGQRDLFFNLSPNLVRGRHIGIRH
jgi:hypothetical protein